MEKLLDWLTDVLQIVNDEYFTLIIKGISERMDELVWRQSAKPCYSKYNLDDIVVWHKGSPQFFIRHEDISECKYTNYPEVVVNNKTIAETIYGDNNRIILRCVILNNN